MEQRALPLLLGAIPLFAFCGFALTTFGYQITRSASVAALTAPIELPLTTMLQAVVFGAGSLDALGLAGPVRTG